MINQDSEYVRKPAWAGTFYESNPKGLQRIVEKYLEKAPYVQVPGQMVGIIAPHAGYDYSGPTAAAAYRLLMDKNYDSVVVIAPCHHEWLEGVSVFAGKAYETPLGEVSVDRQLVKDIVSFSDQIHLSMNGHRSSGKNAEHALEVQLPFLQQIFSDKLKIVPIVFNDYSVVNCKALGKAIITAAGDKKVLIVASSDLYHGNSYDECQSTDTRTLAAIEELNPESFYDGLKHRNYMACGGGPIMSLLFAAKELDKGIAKVVARTNSADVTGVRGGYTVGYAAIAVSNNAD